MGKYIFEIVRGDQHLYLCAGDKIPEEGLPKWMATKAKVHLDPKPRNALRVEGFKEAKALLDSAIALSPDSFRKLAGVDKSWMRPIVINMRRDNETKGLVDCVAAQRMYVFQEQA